MNVNPLDLQVLFSKALDHGANLGKEAGMHEAVVHDLQKQSTTESQNAQETVQSKEDSNEDNNLINPDKNSEKEKRNLKKVEKDQSEDDNNPENITRGLIDASSGHIIDIID